jgi:hypothetical protein
MLRMKTGRNDDDKRNGEKIQRFETVKARLDAEPEGGKRKSPANKCRAVNHWFVDNQL